MDSTYQEPNGNAVPISYAVLSLPTKAAMRKKGFSPDDLHYNGGLAAHPLASWTSHSLPTGATYKDAMTAIHAENKKPWGLLKIRLNFSDGHYEQFERKDVGTPNSLAATSAYDPNGVYRGETMTRSQARRAQQEPRLRPLVNDQGHHLSSAPIPRTFAPEELYKNCPPPVHAQPGYDFTPMSYNSFLLNPQDPPAGIRNVRSNMMHSSADYRPRSYLREGPVDSRHCHCNEVFQVGDYTMDLAKQGSTVDHRNRLVEKDYSPIGTLKSNSTIVGKRNAREARFACSSSGKGGEGMAVTGSNPAAEDTTSA